MPDPYYERHIFFCLNERDNGEDSLRRTHDAQAGFDHCKSRVKGERLAGPGKVRVNKAGCLDRCAGGPVAVVYPEAVWYTYVDEQRHRRDRRLAPEERRGRRAPAAAARRRPLSAAAMTPRTAREHDRRPGRPRSSARSTRPAGAPRGVARRLPSASAVRRHARQQGRADAGARLRRARLGAACASTSAASARSRGRAGTKAAARSTTRSR